MAAQGHNAIAGKRVPNARRCILRATGHEPCSGLGGDHRLPGDAGHKFGVSLQRSTDLLASIAIPEVDQFVHAATGDDLAIGRERDEQYVVFVTFSCIHRTFCVQVPESHCRVTAARGKEATVRRKG